MIGREASRLPHRGEQALDRRERNVVIGHQIVERCTLRQARCHRYCVLLSAPRQPRELRHELADGPRPAPLALVGEIRRDQGSQPTRVIPVR